MEYMLGFVWFLLLQGVSTISENPRVVLQNGMVIVGNTNSTIDQNKQYFSFRGIPYAKPPINELRFRAPVPLSGNLKSTSIYALEDGPLCVQSGIDGNGVYGSEDCLYLNVYTTQLPTQRQQPLPVMVWLHGGGFFGDDGGYAAYGPDYFLNEDVVIVTSNFRLGIFGYLSTGDLASPGNYGLKDQVEVLKWVNSNIRQFGGDSKRVTLFGQSSGAASTAYLTQTPLTTGLLQRAIFQSGSSIHSWAVARHPLVLAKTTAKYLQVGSSNTQTLVDGLRGVDYKTLGEAATKAAFQYINESQSRGGFPFAPAVEPLNSEAIVTGRNYVNISNGFYHRIPYLMGFNSLEGVDLLDIPVKEIQLFATSPRFNPLTIVPESMNIESTSNKTKAYSAIYPYYFGSVPLNFSDTNLIKFNSDDLIARAIIKAATIYSKRVPTYLYRFSYQGVLGSGNRTTPGVGHSEELPYFWRINYDTKIPNPNDLGVRQTLIKLWTTFARDGKPSYGTVDWKTANSSGKGNLAYMDIGQQLDMRLNPELEVTQKWQKWFRMYGNPPYYTY